DRTGGTVDVVAVAEPPEPLPGSLPGPATVTTKTARIADLAFAPGRGTPVIEGSSLQAPSVAPLVSAASGTLVLASGRDERTWSTVQEGGPTAGTAPTGPADGTLVRDTFDRAAVGTAIPTSWYGDRDGPAAAEVTEDPGGGRQLLLTNRDGGDATATCRAVPVTGAPVTVAALVRVEGVGTADTRLLTVKGPEGTLASLRLTRKGLVGYSSPAGRIDHAPLAPGDLRVSVRVDPARGVTDLLVALADGTPVLDLRDVPALSPAGEGPDEVCAAPPPGVPGATLAVRDLTVTPA
ncbi:MAG TPA: hypothetical protein VHK88_12000, partial [Aquihabitans sp.]|nr:hypothetical protein [Aquihabitans sp.]